MLLQSEVRTNQIEISLVCNWIRKCRKCRNDWRYLLAMHSRLSQILKEIALDGNSKCAAIGFYKLTFHWTNAYRQSKNGYRKSRRSINNRHFGWRCLGRDSYQEDSKDIQRAVFEPGPGDPFRLTIIASRVNVGKFWTIRPTTTLFRLGIKEYSLHLYPLHFLNIFCCQ